MKLVPFVDKNYITVRQSGTVHINEHCAKSLRITEKTYIFFYQDAGNPEKWFMQVVGDNVNNLTMRKSKAEKGYYFTCIHLRREIADTLNAGAKAIRLRPVEVKSKKYEKLYELKPM